MDLYRDILAKILSDGETVVAFPQLGAAADGAVELTCCKALCEIKAVLEDEALSDPECFERIERIVSILEKYGSGGGTRHDFG